jgi:hypothetical protein
MGNARHVNFHLNNPDRFDVDQQSYQHMVNIARWVHIPRVAEIGNDAVVVQFTLDKNMGVVVSERGDFNVPRVNLFFSVNSQCTQRSPLKPAGDGYLKVTRFKLVQQFVKNTARNLFSKQVLNFEYTGKKVSRNLSCGFFVLRQCFLFEILAGNCQTPTATKKENYDIIHITILYI